MRHRRNERGIEFERRTVRASEGEKVIEWRRMGMVEGEGRDELMLMISVVIALRSCKSWISRVEAKISQVEGISMWLTACERDPYLPIAQEDILPTDSSPTNRISISPFVHHFPRSFLLSTTTSAACPFTSSSLSRGSSSTYGAQKVVWSEKSKSKNGSESKECLEID